MLLHVVSGCLSRCFCPNSKNLLNFPCSLISGRIILSADTARFLQDFYYKVIAQNEIHRNHTGECATSFALPSFWLYKPLPEHLVPIALRTAYTVCWTYIRVLATGLSSLYYPVRPIRRRPMLRMTSTYMGPLRRRPTVEHTLCHPSSMGER